MIYLSTLKLKDRTKSTNPIKLYERVGLSRDYIDLFMTPNRLSANLYYFFISMNIPIRVHLYEDGPIGYYTPFLEKFKSDGLDHEKYGDRKLENNIIDLLLCEPSLFSRDEYSWPVRPLTKPYRNKELYNLMCYVFGKEDIPHEKYIFFEEANAGLYLGNLYSDFSTLEKIAKIVGKENIAVKRHPRCPIDRFSPAGYKVIKNQKFPWEFALFENNLKGKILMTLRSTAVITPRTLFDQECYILLLTKLIKGSEVQSWDEGYLNKLFDYYNKNQKTLFMPDTEEELAELFCYIQGQDRLTN